MIDALMEELPRMLAGTRETEVALGPAIQAGMEALKVPRTSDSSVMYVCRLGITVSV